MSDPTEPPEHSSQSQSPDNFPRTTLIPFHCFASQHPVSRHIPLQHGVRPSSRRHCVTIRHSRVTIVAGASRSSRRCRPAGGQPHRPRQVANSALKPTKSTSDTVEKRSGAGACQPRRQRNGVKVVREKRRPPSNRRPSAP